MGLEAKEVRAVLSSMNYAKRSIQERRYLSYIYIHIYI